ncbi:hypothetical protein ACIQ57_04470 [Lysinibacillus xylanilyticus]|uniref:hypothetical protein n=1 Tax=Lysinibacillus xylanilyticus TaxID=582475 RepID=UPI0037FD126E
MTSSRGFRPTDVFCIESVATDTDVFCIESVATDTDVFCIESVATDTDVFCAKAKRLRQMFFVRKRSANVAAAATQRWSIRHFHRM